MRPRNERQKSSRGYRIRAYTWPVLITIGDLARDLPNAHPIDLGDNHPTRVGLVLVDAAVDSGTLTKARVQPGFSHRGAEKLFEVRDYRQVLMLADRHDWQTPAHGEIGLAITAEHLMGLVASPRATMLRTLLAEFSTAGCLLAHLSWVAQRADDERLAVDILRARGAGRELMLGWSGNRVHPMLTRLGGMAADVDDKWLSALLGWVQAIDHFLPALDAHIDSFPDGVGILDAAMVEQLGLGGPVARAAGLGRDLRSQTSALAYASLHTDSAHPEALNTTPVTSSGSAIARLHQLVADLRTVSLLIRACAAALPALDGPIETPLAKIVKLPDAEAYLALEAPWGPAGFHIVSRAERTPWRVHLRTPSFANAQALEVALAGCPLEWVDLVVASLGWTIGDLDK